MGKKIFKILWIYYKTVVSGTSSDETLITNLRERKRFPGRPVVIIYSWLPKDRKRAHECSSHTKRHIKTAVGKQPTREQTHGQASTSVSTDCIHTALHTTGHVSTSTLLAWSLYQTWTTLEKSLKNPFSHPQKSQPACWFSKTYSHPLSTYSKSSSIHSEFRRLTLYMLNLPHPAQSYGSYNDLANPSTAAV